MVVGCAVVADCCFCLLFVVTWLLVAGVVEWKKGSMTTLPDNATLSNKVKQNQNNSNTRLPDHSKHSDPPDITLCRGWGMPRVFGLGGSARGGTPSRERRIELESCKVMVALLACRLFLAKLPA